MIYIFALIFAAILAAIFLLLNSLATVVFHGHTRPFWMMVESSILGTLIKKFIH